MDTAPTVTSLQLDSSTSSTLPSSSDLTLSSSSAFTTPPSLPMCTAVHPSIATTLSPSLSSSSAFLSSSTHSLSGGLSLPSTTADQLLPSLQSSTESLGGDSTTSSSSKTTSGKAKGAGGKKKEGGSQGNGRKPANAPVTIAHSRTGHTWTSEQDDLLREAILRNGTDKWAAITEHMLPFSFSSDECAVRWDEIKDVPVKGPWSVEEDALLQLLVGRYGPRPKKWSMLAQHIPGRAGKQCRERWLNHLDRSVKKGEWEEGEDAILCDAQRRLGNKWSEIAKLLPGRAENSVKNRFNSLITRRNSHRYGPGPLGVGELSTILPSSSAPPSAPCTPSKTTATPTPTIPAPGAMPGPQPPPIVSFPFPSSPARPAMGPSTGAGSKRKTEGAKGEGGEARKKTCLSKSAAQEGQGGKKEGAAASKKQGGQGVSGKEGADAPIPSGPTFYSPTSMEAYFAFLNKFDPQQFLQLTQQQQQLLFSAQPSSGLSFGAGLPFLPQPTGAGTLHAPPAFLPTAPLPPATTNNKTKGQTKKETKEQEDTQHEQQDGQELASELQLFLGAPLSTDASLAPPPCFPPASSSSSAPSAAGSILPVTEADTQDYLSQLGLLQPKPAVSPSSSFLPPSSTPTLAVPDEKSRREAAAGAREGAHLRAKDVGIGSGSSLSIDMPGEPHGLASEAGQGPQVDDLFFAQGEAQDLFHVSLDSQGWEAARLVGEQDAPGASVPLSDSLPPLYGSAHDTLKAEGREGKEPLEVLNNTPLEQERGEGREEGGVFMQHFLTAFGAAEQVLPPCSQAEGQHQHTDKASGRGSSLGSWREERRDGGKTLKRGRREEEDDNSNMMHLMMMSASSTAIEEMLTDLVDDDKEEDNMWGDGQIKRQRLEIL